MLIMFNSSLVNFMVRELADDMVMSQMYHIPPNKKKVGQGKILGLDDPIIPQTDQEHHTSKKIFCRKHEITEMKPFA